MQTVKQVFSRNVLIYVIMQEISILLAVKASKMGTPSSSFSQIQDQNNSITAPPGVLNTALPGRIICGVISMHP